jgi:hypothetical protein
MPTVREPIAAAEIIPPRRPGAAGRSGVSWRKQAASGVFDDEHLDILSHVLDDFIRIPGTPIRFGLDGIVGFIPGIGDILGGIASTIIIFAAWVRGVPAITIARMVLNVAIETIVGSVPVLGNFFDIAWRANRRNYRLLEGSIADPRRHTFGSWLIFGAVALVLVAIMLIPTLLLAWLLAHVTAVPR